VDPSTRARTHDPWEWWNAFRSACDGHASLGAVLDIGASLPPDEDWRRWIGEPLKCALIP
jgi:protein arginine N-methyltransferase 5